MQKIKKTGLLFIYLSLIVLAVACKKDEDNTAPPAGEFQHAVFIVNEGNFTAGNASLTYYNEQTGKVQPQIFYRVNEVPLGDVANSVSYDGNNLYIVVNNSHVVYKIEALTGKYLAKLTGLTSPRKMLLLGEERALISDLYETSLIEVNTETMDIISRIPIGRTSENMLLWNKRIFVANWSAFQQTQLNNIIIVVDTKTMQMSDSIQVGIEPNSMVMDKENNLWVLCSGGYEHTEMASLWKINPSSGKVINTFEFSNENSSPGHLCVNSVGDTLYFLNRDVFRMTYSAATLPDTPFIKADVGIIFYSLAVSPHDDIYVTDANDYTKNGTVYRYNSNGTLKQKFEAGIIPGDICFTE